MKYTFHGFWKEFNINDGIFSRYTFPKVLTFLNGYQYTDNIEDTDIIIYSVFSPNLELLKKRYNEGCFIIQFTGEARWYDKEHEFTHITIGNDGATNQDIIFPYYYTYKKLIDNYKIQKVPFSQKKDFVIVISNATKDRIEKFQTIKNVLNEFAIDCFGKMFDKPIFNKHWDKEYIQLLASYKYVICMENTVRDYYHTEKIYNAFLAHTIPLYGGADTVDNTFNSEKIIKLNTNFLEKIKNINEDEYEKIISLPLCEKEYDISVIKKILSFPKIYWINCEQHKKRYTYMKNQLKMYRNERIKGVYINTVDKIYDHFILPANRDLKTYATDFRPGIFGCLLSHLETIRKIASTDEDGIILEDDADVSLLLGSEWDNIFSKFPKDADLVQFYTISRYHNEMYNYASYKNGLLKLVPGIDWAATAYWIKNDYAKKIIKKYYEAHPFGRYNLSEYKDKWLVADYFIFLDCNAYKFPLVKVNSKLDSTLDHKENFDMYSRGVDRFYKDAKLNGFI